MINKNITHLQKPQSQIEQDRNINYYNSEQSKKISLIIEGLDNINCDEKIQKIKQINANRHALKLKIQRLNFKNIQQNALIPTDGVPKIFSQIQPICSHQPFLDGKEKQKVIYSGRMFLRKPNLKTGIYQPKSIAEAQKQMKSYHSRKFSEYDKIISEQSGPMRILLQKKSMLEKNLTVRRPIYSGKNGNIFSKFNGSRYDFYEKSPDPEKITNLLQNSQRLTTVWSLQKIAQQKQIKRKKNGKIKLSGLQTSGLMDRSDNFSGRKLNTNYY